MCCIINFYYCFIFRNKGIAQNVLTKELHIPANNLSYQFKTLETQGLLVKQPSVIRKNGTIVSTNMIYLARYATHLGFQQRLEITKTDQTSMDGEAVDSHTGTHDDSVTENIFVKDFVPAMKAICDKLAKAEGKVCSEHDLNPHTYFFA